MLSLHCRKNESFSILKCDELKSNITDFLLFVRVLTSSMVNLDTTTFLSYFKITSALYFVVGFGVPGSFNCDFLLDKDIDKD